MNLKRIYDADNSQKSTVGNTRFKRLKDSVNVDYESGAVNALEEEKFGVSQILMFSVDDKQAYVCDDLDPAVTYGSVWKVKGKNKVEFSDGRENIKIILKDTQYLEQMVEFFDMSLKEIKADLRDCYNNYEKYMNEAVKKVEKAMSD